MSKRENLLKAMEQIDDGKLDETAKIMMGEQSLEEKEAHTSLAFRRVLGAVLSAACIAGVLLTATFKIWRGQSGGTQNVGMNSADTDLSWSAQAKSEEVGTDAVEMESNTEKMEKILWRTDAQQENCFSMEGVLVRFENGTAMLLVDNYGAVVLQGWDEISGNADFENFDIIRVFINQENGIQETYPAGARIEGVLEETLGKAQSSDHEEELKLLEEMGYTLSGEDAGTASTGIDENTML